MMKKTNKTLLLAMGTTLITGLTSIPASAETVDMQGSAFKMTELSSGYMQLAAADTATENATKSSSAKAKTMEGKCAGAKPMPAPKATEGKCGEGKCGDAMKKAAAESVKSTTEPTKTISDGVKPATETSTKTKATEGKCGEGKCGDAMKKTKGDSVKPSDTGAGKK